MSKILQAELLVDCQNALGECVIYRPDERRLYWTDINGQEFLHSDESGKDLVRLALPEELGSFAFDPQGNLLAAFRSGLYRMRPDTGEREQLTQFEPELSATRLNDGRCDRAGRFVVGGCHEGFYNPVSSVLSYDGKSARTLISEVALTNAIAFSPDGTRMYFSDSETLKLEYFDYDAERGLLGDRHLFVELPKGVGFADGSCVDVDGNLWNARYYGGIVQQYHPDGSEGIRVEVAADCVTCVCFGGEDLDTLFITTARKDLKDGQLASQPHAGGLFRVKLPTRGLKETNFAQSLYPL